MSAPAVQDRAAQIVDPKITEAARAVVADAPPLSDDQLAEVVAIITRRGGRG